MKKQKKILQPLVNHGVCWVALLGCAGLASAQAPALGDMALSEKDFLGEMPIVLSVSRLPQRLDETPGAVTLIDRHMIRLSGARDVADLLRLVPGFQTSTSFEAEAPQASYHGAFGSYPNRMQVLVDGRSVYSPFFVGSISPGLQTVALTDIERIEVLRGSNSAAYGARAVLGVINIVTRHTADTLGALVALSSGENGIRDGQARIGWGHGSGSFRLSMDRRADAGLAGSNGHNQVNRVNFRADLRPGVNDEIQLQAGGLAIDSGKGFATTVDSPLRDPYWGSGYVQLDWRRSLGSDEDLALSVSHTQETYRDTFAYSLIPLGIDDSLSVDSSGDASNDSLSLQHTFRFGSAVRLVWGGELRREQVNSKPLYNTDANFVTDFTRLFGNAEWRFAPNLVLNAGAMAEHSSITNASFAPRLMLNWHAAPGHTLRAGISRAYRPPSTFEKYADVRYFWRGHQLKVTTQASGKVKAESVLARELGYLGVFPALGLNLDVRAFQEIIGNFVKRVESAPRSNRYDYANSDDFSILGIEYQLKWRPWRNAQLTFNQAYVDIRSADPGTATSAPRLASSLTLFQKLPGGLDLSLILQDAGTMTLPGGSDGEQNWMTRTDLRLGLPLRFGPNRGELALVVQNLNSPYADFKQGFEFQRRAFVTLRVEN